MSKYIDKDAWWQEVQKLYTDGDCADIDRYKLGINVGITASRGVMDHLPSTKIVDCKECKHYHVTDKVYAYCTKINIKGKAPAPDFWCRYGERRSDE